MTLTYEDLQRMFSEDDMHRRELVGGELIVTPSPGLRHQRVVAVLTARLYAYAETFGGEVLPSPFDVYFTSQDVLEPDVLFVTADHVTRLEDRYIRQATDIVVEVSSPSTRRIDLTRKRDLYERHGAPEYWFVDLDADRVDVYRLEKGRYGEPTGLSRGDTLTSPLLPGLELAVAEILGRE